MSNNNSKNNIILLSDSYKVSHARQYPKGTTEVYSYFESRGGVFDEITFFGLQYFLKEYLSKPITQDDIDEADELYEAHFGAKLFDKGMWEHILKVHGGLLPLSIRAVPEGTVVGTKNVLMTVVNTDPRCFALTNYMETLLSQIWNPCTVASLSRQQKKVLKKYLEKTSDSTEGLPFKLHDFSCRGVSSMETSGISGVAHLVNFLGTDVVPALVLARDYYEAPIAGFSIAASEHSTITSYGEEGELKAFENMLDQYPTGLVACVSDSFDIYRACRDYWGTTLRDKILARDGTLVIRPDSMDARILLPELLEILYEKFGGTINSKGYKLLPPQVRLIQGDGIDRDSLPEILEEIEKAGFSTDNLAFGSGGGLAQKINRDTCKFAFKCSSITVDGEQRDVFKRPVGAEWKMSKKGKMKLVEDRGWKDHRVSQTELITVGLDDPRPDQLVEVFRNGQILIEYSLDEIRKRAEID